MVKDFIGGQGPQRTVVHEEEKEEDKEEEKEDKEEYEISGSRKNSPRYCHKCENVFT